MIFQHPQFLWLLLLLPVVVLARRRWVASVPHPAGDQLSALPKSWRGALAAIGPWLQGAGLLLSITALARPQLVDSPTTVTSQGVDIALALDLSSSMLAVDGRTADPGRTRLAIAKDVIGNFIRHRSGDRISVVAFGARAYPVAPLTLDHEWLLSRVRNLEPGTVEDGTALGDGIAAAANRLRLSPAQSRTVVVLTDGRSNAGSLSPSSAASAAAAFGIKIYTIGIGGSGKARFPVANPFGGVAWREITAELDEEALKRVSATTGGKYFRAQGSEELANIFAELDRLEKRKIQETNRHTVKELFPHFLCSALLLIMLDQILKSTCFRRVP